LKAEFIEVPVNLDEKVQALVRPGSLEANRIPPPAQVRELLKALQADPRVVLV
jgi:hypothetical protein